MMKKQSLDANLIKSNDDFLEEKPVQDISNEDPL